MHDLIWHLVGVVILRILRFLSLTSTALAFKAIWRTTKVAFVLFIVFSLKSFIKNRLTLYSDEFSALISKESYFRSTDRLVV